MNSILIIIIIYMYSDVIQNEVFRTLEGYKSDLVPIVLINL